MYLLQMTKVLYNFFVIDLNTVTTLQLCCILALFYALVSHFKSINDFLFYLVFIIFANTSIKNSTFILPLCVLVQTARFQISIKMTPL